MTFDELGHVLVRARDEPSPLYEPEDPRAFEDLGAFTRNVPLDDYRLDLPPELADALRSWSLTHPPGGFASRPDLREYVTRGLDAVQRLAEHLGPSWTVRYFDEGRGSAKWLCWGCDRPHGEPNPNGTPSHPLDITVEGEYGWGPLRSDGFGDFMADDPGAALPLSGDLVAALRTWAESIDTTLNLDLRDRVDGKYDAEWQRLFREGMDLAERTAHELGPTRTVTYKGLANGGLDALTSVTWQGDRKL
ncbi:hypothetical protein ABZ353_04775 [Streptomyces niveus]|uniref:hypothetical protein n=1 Tax=Streptomyces niveus TaxID=193462 RepID=UPI0033F8F45A